MASKDTKPGPLNQPAGARKLIEAIRPTDARNQSWRDESTTKLYNLIWRRALVVPNGASRFRKKKTTHDDYCQCVLIKVLKPKVKLSSL